MSNLTLHLIGNAHLDPVWLWDWREGLNEGITTIRTILDLMDEQPEMTFIRGESAIYRHVERYDPATFARLRRAFEAGRWDIVGGNLIQPDTNLPSTEALIRQFETGKRYFREKFGFEVEAAWAADSFGHPAGLPDILHRCGFKYFAFTRPPHKVMPLTSAAFHWRGAGGATVLAYRPRQVWYGTERDAMARTLDDALEEAQRTGLRNVGCFYGLGNHGGGPTRRHLREIAAWANAHPEVRVVHSGLHRLFRSLEAEIAERGDQIIPTHEGELGFVLRGCYASSARFKFLYRKAEALLLRTEQIDRVITGALGAPPANLERAWDGLLFNGFHDILPGTSIERATDEQVEWVGGILHDCREVEADRLNHLWHAVDTTVLPPQDPDMPTGVPLLVFNPHDTPYVGPIELEAAMDYRPIWAYADRPAQLPLRLLGPDRQPVAFQEVTTENRAMRHLPWRKRVVLHGELPSRGWQVYELAWVESTSPPTGPSAIPADAPTDDTIRNGIYQVRARPGDTGIQVLKYDQSLFHGSGLEAVVYDDPWGSWGGMEEEAESIDISKMRERWVVRRADLLERGPHRARLWVLLHGENERSRLELTFSLFAGRDAVDVSARVMWNERSARLKLVLPCGDQAEFEVPGGTVHRGPCGEVPGGRWVRVAGNPGVGLATDAPYGFDAKDGALCATICRAMRYADDSHQTAEAEPWNPATDAGELKFRFVLTAGRDDISLLARELEQPILVQSMPPSPGPRGRKGVL